MIQDGPLLDMTSLQWSKAVLPKVQGTWNLHNALLAQTEPLDFFFLFSSVGAMAGQWGQANYAAGNTFLDAFVQYRHSLGLPCSTVNIGVIEDIGYLSLHPDKLETLRATAIHTVHEQELLDSIELAILRSQPGCCPPLGKGYANRAQIGLGIRSTLPLSAPSNRTLWRKDPRMSVYRNLETQSNSKTSGSGSDKLKNFLRDASSNLTLLKSPDTQELLATEIGKTLFGFMMRTDEELDLHESMNNLGMDSLIGIELRNWLRQRLGVEFTVLEVVGANSILAMGGLAQQKLVAKAEAKE